MKDHPKWILFLCGIFLLAGTGCEKDEIRKYQVAKNEPAAPVAGKGDKQPVRLLAAILPHAEKTWFFKLMGPVASVQEQQDGFDRFMQSVRFKDGGQTPLEWTLPEGWRPEQSAEKMRFATFKIAGKEGESELIVSALEGKGGDTLGNVNRWRGQISLQPIAEADLSKYCTDHKLEAGPAIYVEMTGVRGGKSAMMPPFASNASKRPSPPPANEGSSELDYRVPAGWEKMPNVQFSAASFRVKDGNEIAKVTVSPLGGPAGGMPANVNRWRAQVGLGPIDEAQLAKEVSEIDVAGSKGKYVDVIGPAGPDGQKLRILGVALLRGDTTWFVKMQGQAELLQKQKSYFEEFVKSLKFDGGKGANHE